MPKKSKKPAPEPDKDEGRVVFVSSRIRRGEVGDDEIMVRLPFPRETKWSPDDLGLSIKGAGVVGGLSFDHYGQAMKTKIGDEVLGAIKSNQLQVVAGRLQKQGR